MQLGHQRGIEVQSADTQISDLTMALLPKPPKRRVPKLINFILLVLVQALALLSFFAIMELLLTFAANVIFHNIESTVRQRYALVTVRNFWLLGGGVLLVGWTIGSFNYYFNRLAQDKTRRRLLLILIIEFVVVAAGYLVSG